MAWEERMQVAAYTSPSGARFEFLYDAVSVSVEKKTTTFNFPEFDGAYIQDLGRAGRVYPFTLYFTGIDYDKTANSFMLALEETGIGLLEHPLYGNRSVVPTGSITRKDNLIKNANKAVFTVSFSETLKDLTFPQPSNIPESDLLSNADAFQEANASAIGDELQIDIAVEGIAARNAASASVNAIADSLSGIVESDPKTLASFKTILASFGDAIQDLSSDTLTPATLAIMLIRTPGRVLGNINTKIDTYGAIISNTIKSIEILDGTNNPINRLVINSMLVRAALVSLCESTIFSRIRTRKEAVSTANAILDYSDQINTWHDNSVKSLSSYISTSNAYDEVQSVISSAIQYLIKESFALPLERRVVLQDDKQVIQFLAEEGLVVEDSIDLFIQLNNLTADTIEILPSGMEVVYYG